MLKALEISFLVSMVKTAGIPSVIGLLHWFSL